MRAVVGIQSCVAKYGLKIAKLVTRSSRVSFDFSNQLEISLGKGRATPIELLQTQYSFLAYASEYWLSHIARASVPIIPAWDCWKLLVFTEHSFAIKPWIVEDKTAKELLIDYILNESHNALVACLCLNYSTQYINKVDLLIRAFDMEKSKFIELALGLDDSQATGPHQ